MTLNLDVVTNVDYSKIQAEVQKIRDNLAKIPDKVKINIQVDTTGGASSYIKNLRKDIDALTSSAGSMGKSVSKALETAQKNAAAAYTSGWKSLGSKMDSVGSAPKEAVDRYNDLADAMQSLDEKIHSGAATADDLTEATNKVSSAIKQMNAAFAEQDVYDKMIAKEEKAAEAAEKLQAANAKALETAQKNAAAAYTSGKNALSQYSGISTDSNGNVITEYAELESAVTALHNARETGANDAKGLESATNNVILSVKNLSAALVDQKIKQDGSNDIIRKYTESVNVLNNAEKNLKSWSQMKFSADSNAVGAYKDFANAVKGLREARAAYDGTAESADRLATAARNVTDVMQRTEAVGYRTGTLASNIITKIGGVIGQFGAMVSGIRGIQAAVRSVKYLAKEAQDIDDSMTQLKIVTNESDETFRKYGEDVAQTAQKIGSSITDVIDATTVYARLGYSLSDSSKLAELTAMLQRVGDVEASDAQSSLTSIIKAFDIDVSDMESVMDKLVTVGNGFPISVSEIADGMMNASSALAAAGNSFDKSVALIAAANTTLQDANKASTGLRTITARLRKTDSELNDLGEAMTQSAYEDLVGALTKYNVALRDANGEYRDTYDIMGDIAAAWKDMASSEQAALAELAAGNRQQTVFYSIIQNFDNVAKKSMEAMNGSEGAMQDAYSEWMDSISAHTQALKAALQGLSNDLISNELLKGFVDIETRIVNIGDGIVRWNDDLIKLTVTIGGIVALINSIKSIS